MADMEVHASTVQTCLCLFYRRKEATPWEPGGSCRATYGPSGTSPGLVVTVSESTRAVRIRQRPGLGACACCHPSPWGCRRSPAGVRVSLGPYTRTPPL